MFRKNQKSFRLIEIAIVLLVIANLITIGWIVFRSGHKTSPTKISSITRPAKPTPATTSPSPSPLTVIDFSGKQRFSMSTGIEMFNDSDSDVNAQMQGIKAIGAAWLRAGLSWRE